MRIQRGRQNVYHIGLQGTLTIRQAGDLYDQYLVYDTFTDTNGTSVDAHTPEKDSVGAGWVEVAGNWSITTNRVYNPGAANNYIIIDAGAANMKVTGIIFPPASTAPGCVFRWSSATAHWLSELDEYTGDTVDLYLNDNGYSLITQTFGVAMTPAEQTQVIDVGDDDVIDVYVNGTKVITSTQALFNTATKAGFRSSTSDTGEYMTFFSVENTA